MPRLGLALSGGGFRATLFHLGVLRFLRETDRLQNVTDIASVSGGSILAAHLVLNWGRYSGSDEQFEEAAAEIVRFCQFDLRNFIVRRLPLQFPLRLTAKLVRRSVRNLTPNAILERCYETHLYGDRCLYELPLQPALHILATNVSNGGLSVFNRNGLFIQQRVDSGEAQFEHIPTRMASIPRVVGASSAFPGFFPPVEVTAADLGVREGEFPTEYFTDGGVFDNLGIRAFSWLRNQGEQFDDVIVSDAGKPFQILSDSALGIVGQSMRATDILWDRVWQLERENFGRQVGFIFLPITEIVSETESPTLHPVIQSEVQSIRTDLDRFSDEEINALVQHGYGVARKVLRQHWSDAVGMHSEGPSWAPIAGKQLPTDDKTTLSNAHGASTATVVGRRLRNSSARRVWSTLLDFRDWPTYLYVAMALLIFGYMPWRVYELYNRAQMLTTVNAAITQGDPDIRRVLDLVAMNPAEDWQSEVVSELAEATAQDYADIELLTYSRIVDLRRWNPLESDATNRAQVYVNDRVRLKLSDAYRGSHRVTLTLPLPVSFQNVTFRRQESGRPFVIRRVAEPIEEFGVSRTQYEFDFDLRGVALREPVTLEMQMLVDVPQETASASFITRMKTDLVSMWMLFPEDRPYRSYNLVQYPVDRTAPPSILESRYRIDHPYGALIGWSVVNPRVGSVYECRWEYD